MSVRLSTIEEIVSQINKGRLHEAHKIAKKMASNHFAEGKEEKSILLSGQTVIFTSYNDRFLSKILHRMSNCPDSTAIIMGDWMLYGALIAARNHEFNEADRFLCKAKEYYNGNKSCLSKLSMAQGQIAYYLKDFSQSALAYQMACAQCCEDEMDEDLVADIHFFTLKAITANKAQRNDRFRLTHQIIGKPYLDIYQEKTIYSLGDKRFTRRCRARLINLGRIGNMIDDVVFPF